MKHPRPQSLGIDVKPIKQVFTYPAFELRDHPVTMEVDGLLISSLHPERSELDDFQLLVDENGYAPDYPYLMIICVSQKVTPVNQWIWRKTSVHIPML